MCVFSDAIDCLKNVFLFDLVVVFHSGKRRLCCVGRLVFVHLGENSRPRKVPKLITSSEVENDKLAAAMKRRDLVQREKRASVQQAWRSAWSEEERSLNERGAESGVYCSSTTVEMSKLVMPQHANPLNITFGGQVMAWMELAASISAARLAKGYAITVGLDRMMFRHGSKVGELLVIKAQVNRVFGKSLEVGVRVESFGRGVSVYSKSLNQTILISLDFFAARSFDTLQFRYVLFLSLSTTPNVSRLIRG